MEHTIGAILCVDSNPQSDFPLFGELDGVADKVDNDLA
jgi:hypothetical protein